MRANLTERLLLLFLASILLLLMANIGVSSKNVVAIVLQVGK